MRLQNTANPPTDQTRAVELNDISMRLKNIEYRVMQGIERGVWHWLASLDHVDKQGRIARIKSHSVEPTREKAVERTLHAIDRTLTGPKLRLEREATAP